MEFHGMKRKNLQSLCKKHGIPANLKNDEMASRLASVFKKKIEVETVDSDGVKPDKKVSFSPEIEVFEFTRSVKKHKRKNVRSRKQGSVQAIQQGVIELRRSNRTVAKSKTRRETVEIEKEMNLLDDSAAKTQNVRKKRSKRIGSSGSTQEGCDEVMMDKETSKGLSGNTQEGSLFEKVVRRSTRLAVNGGTSSKEVTLLPFKRSKLDVVTEDKEEEEEEDKLVKNSSYKAERRRVTRRMKRDRSTEAEIEIETVSTLGKLLDDTTVEARGSSKKSKRTSQECFEVSPFTSETKAAESVVANEKEEISSDSPLVHLAVSSPEAEILASNGHTIHKDMASTMTVEENTKEETVVSTPISELKEHESEAKSSKVEGECLKEVHSSQEDEKGSSLEKEVKGENLHGNFSECNAENNNAEEETEENTKDETVVSSPRPEFKEHESVSKSSKVEEIECWKEIQSSEEDEKGSLEKKVQVASVHGNFFESNTEDNNAEEEESEISKVGCVNVGLCVSLTPEKLLDDCAHLESEEAGVSSKKHDQNSVLIAETTKDKEETSSLSESVIVCSEVTPRLASVQVPTGHTLVKDSVSEVITDDDIKTKEEFLIFTPSSELKEQIFVSKLAKAEEIMENSAKLCKDDKKSSSEKDLAAEEEVKTMEQECLKDKPQGVVEGSPFKSETEATESVMIHENVLSSSVIISPKSIIQELKLELTTEGEREEKHEQDTLVMPNSQILLKDIASEEDIETKEESLVSTPKPEQEEHSFVAKFEETKDTEVLQNPFVLWEEIHSSKDDTRDTLEKDLQETPPHENFPEGNTEKEENILECFEKEETRALSQPSLLNKANSISLDEFAGFTTPERNLMLMEQLSEIEKTTCVVAKTENHHHDEEAVDSCNDVFTVSEEQVRREQQVLICRTQVKAKRHDMKENEHNSKIVDNLNLTAPRTSKRHPLQGLK